MQIFLQNAIAILRMVRNFHIAELPSAMTDTAVKEEGAAGEIFEANDSDNRQDITEQQQDREQKAQGPDR